MVPRRASGCLSLSLNLDSRARPMPGAHAAGLAQARAAGLGKGRVVGAATLKKPQCLLPFFCPLPPNSPNFLLFLSPAFSPVGMWPRPEPSPGFLYVRLQDLFPSQRTAMRCTGLLQVWKGPRLPLSLGILTALLEPGPWPNKTQAGKQVDSLQLCPAAWL